MEQLRADRAQHDYEVEVRLHQVMTNWNGEVEPVYGYHDDKGYLPAPVIGLARVPMACRSCGDLASYGGRSLVLLAVLAEEPA